MGLSPPPGMAGGGRVQFPRVFTPAYDPDLETDPTLGQRLATLSAEVTTAVDSLNDRLEAVAGRVVGAEAAHRSLAEDARTALDQLLAQARVEFESQGFSFLTLRAEVQQEALELRG